MDRILLIACGVGTWYGCVVSWITGDEWGWWLLFNGGGCGRDGCCVLMVVVVVVMMLVVEMACCSWVRWMLLDTSGC